MTIAGDERLRLFRPDKPATALGLAVSHLMTKPAFAKLRFGEWSKILVGQINRGHYAFVVDAEGQVQGFVGWALATRDKAEAWAEGHQLSYADSLQGECLLFNCWSANSTRVHRFMVDEARKLIRDKETLYFRRHYPDGSVRPVRLSVNDFVEGHIHRHAGRSAASPIRAEAESPAMGP